MNEAVIPGAGDLILSGPAADVEAVKEVMKRYAWSLDMCDWERLETCFAPDILFETSDMGRHEGARALIAQFQTRTVRVPVRRHSIATPYVRVEGDRAEFTAYILNTRYRPRAPGGEFFMAGGYYRNSFKRTADGWKITNLRFEGLFVEGNTRMNPAAAPAPYYPVMKGLADAGWGGATVPAVPGASNIAQVRDLVFGMARAADARSTGDVEAAFTPEAAGDVAGSGEVKGAAALAAALCPPGGPAWTMHFLTNDKISVVGDTADFGVYVYRITPGAQGEANTHAGGVMVGTARRTEAGWRIAECRTHILWTRGVPLYEDPLVRRQDIAAAAKKLWANEDRRERGTVQEEILALHWKYTWSFDLNDPAQNTQVFADDVEVSITLDQIVRHFGRHDWITANLAGRNRQMVTLHYVTNPIVTHMYNPDLAEIRTYVMTRRTAPGDPGPVMIAGGHYRAVAQRIDGQWKYVIFQFVRSHGAFE
ncbi:MAG: nuclear transport factor 2 family protein [Rhizobiaceae bacterium]|nr:nuclear transport factor 2 family protein [Rhizobiaceae bacterium]